MGQIIHTDEFGATRVLSHSEAEQALAQSRRVLGGTNIDGSLQKYTFLQTLSPWPSITPNGWKIAGNSYLRMLLRFTSPGVLYAILAGAVTMGCAQGMGVTIALSELITSYLGTVPAALVALLYSGWVADKVSVFLAKRNDGVHKPEMRLIPLIFPFIVGLVSLMVYGVCVEYPERYTWVGPVLAWNIYMFTFVSVLVLMTTFAAEIRPLDPGPALVVAAASKNFISFSIQYGMVPLVDSQGYLWAMGILAIIFAGSFLLGIPVYFFNPRWRARATRKKQAGHMFSEQDIYYNA
ncbi:hypothetical protein JX266_012027 [Neoarthrinium moseri]|nr:hypothetical protein JX266_012027 [Neoarthrinium moseri]